MRLKYAFILLSRGKIRKKTKTTKTSPDDFQSVAITVFFYKQMKMRLTTWIFLSLPSLSTRLYTWSYTKAFRKKKKKEL